MFDWTDYRRKKLRLIVALSGWIPFGLILAAVLPDVLDGYYTPSCLLAACYMFFTGFAWLQYRSYPCVNCERPYRGEQLYRKRCAHCGVLINP
jgi:hypothetical protein